MGNLVGLAKFAQVPFIVESAIGDKNVNIESLQQVLDLMGIHMKDLIEGFA
jgi:hypothetical protein